MCSLWPVPFSYLCVWVMILGVLKIVCRCTIKPEGRCTPAVVSIFTDSAACVLSFYTPPLHYIYIYNYAFYSRAWRLSLSSADILEFLLWFHCLSGFSIYLTRILVINNKYVGVTVLQIPWMQNLILIIPALYFIVWQCACLPPPPPPPPPPRSWFCGRHNFIDAHLSEYQNDNPEITWERLKVKFKSFCTEYTNTQSKNREHQKHYYKNYMNQRTTWQQNPRMENCKEKHFN